MDLEVGRLSWIIQADSTCSRLRLCEREAEGDWTRRQDGDVTTGKMIGVVQPRAKECWQLPGRLARDLSLEPAEECGSADTLASA